jgi:hypothetical protein
MSLAKQRNGGTHTMIDKISDVRIQETVMEETTQAPEQQAQDKVGAEVESLVQATPEYKSGLVAEQRLGGQVLANQLNSQIPSAQNDVRTGTTTRDPAPPMKSVSETVKDTLKQVPGATKAILGEIAEAWSDPGAVLDQAAENAKQKWDDIKAGK